MNKTQKLDRRYWKSVGELAVFLAVPSLLALGTAAILEFRKS